MNTIPIDIYFKEKLDMPDEISYTDAVEVMFRYNEDAASKLLYKAVKDSVKTGKAGKNKSGRFVWNH